MRVFCQLPGAKYFWGLIMLQGGNGMARTMQGGGAAAGCIAALLLASVCTASPVTAATAQAPVKRSTASPAATAQAPVKRSSYEREMFGKTNEATIGLAAGLPEGAPLD